MSYQDEFLKVYKELAQTERGANEYGQLVYALQYVFELAGRHISGDELARGFHNQISWAIGKTDLKEIGRGFIAAFNTGRNMWPPYALQKIVAGETAIDYRTRQSPTIAPGILAAWQSNVNEALKKANVRRGTKAYRTFLESKADQAGPTMILKATEAKIEKQKELDKAFEKVREEHKKAQEAIDHMTRAIYIIKSFCKVAGVQDEWDIIPELEQRIRLLEYGIEYRLKSIERIHKTMSETEPEQIVASSVLPKKDLNLLWRLYAPNSNATSESGNLSTPI